MVNLKGEEEEEHLTLKWRVLLDLCALSLSLSFVPPEYDLFHFILLLVTLNSVT